MGKYLDLLRCADNTTRGYDINDINDQSPPFGRFGRFGRTLEALETRCPNYIAANHWQQAVEDGRRFLAQWGAQAEALGWTPRELFGLASVPDKPGPSYRRLSRYDETGLIWLLRGRPVLALTESTAAIESRTGAVTIYRRYRRPARGQGENLF
jgi:hypothetical protein